MISPQPGFSPAEYPQLPPQAQQMPNGNMMGVMQDPIFMQQVVSANLVDSKFWLLDAFHATNAAAATIDVGTKWRI